MREADGEVWGDLVSFLMRTTCFSECQDSQDQSPSESCSVERVRHMRGVAGNESRPGSSEGDVVWTE